MEKFIKITEEMYCDESFDIKQRLTDRVETFITGNICDFESLQYESLLDCESPIEQMLALELDRLDIQVINLYNPFIDVVNFQKQREIIVGCKKYRADFFIEVHYKKPKDRVVRFVIECDGFAYHANKTQMGKDYVRTRALQEAGYEVIKFTGSEIYHGAYKCALEVLSAIVQKLELFMLSEA